MSNIYLLTPDEPDELVFSGSMYDFSVRALVEEVYDMTPPYYRYWETERGTMCDFGSHTDFLLIADD